MAGRWVKNTYAYTGSTQLWTCPAGVNVVFLRGIGGGGGGGKGLAGTTVSSGAVGGAGSGGGGAIETLIAVNVVPGTSYYVIIGVGGTGATVNDGGAGGDTIFKDVGSSTGQDVARFNGAMGGRLGVSNGNVQGGEPVRAAAIFNNWYHPIPGLGGYGGYLPSPVRGCSGFSHHGGGMSGADNSGLGGVTSGVKFGGGGGGGGGGGAGYDSTTFGVGGAGGNGNGAGAGSAGAAGSAGTAGGGGGGGGGGGCGSTAGGAGGNGGNGGNGHLVIEWVE